MCCLVVTVVSLWHLCCPTFVRNRLPNIPGYLAHLYSVLSRRQEYKRARRNDRGQHFEFIEQTELFDGPPRLRRGNESPPPPHCYPRTTSDRVNAQAIPRPYPRSSSLLQCSNQERNPGVPAESNPEVPGHRQRQDLGQTEVLQRSLPPVPAHRQPLIPAHRQSEPPLVQTGTDGPNEQDSIRTNHQPGTSIRNPNFVQPFRINAVGEVQRMTVTIELNDRPIKALFDTGCSRTLLLQSMAEEMEINQIKQEVECKAITGDLLPVSGRITGDLKLGKRTLFNQQILIADKCPYDMIIGLDVMKKLSKFTIDLENDMISFKGGKLCISGRHDVTAVNLCCHVHIPANSEVHALARTSILSANDFLFQPKHEPSNSPDIKGAHAVITPSTGEVLVRLINTRIAC